MHPAIRTQVDDLAQDYSRRATTDCSNKPDMARQEFKQETDINYILSRYGANTPTRNPEYGAIDYDMDLQRAIATLDEAQQAINKLPEPIRNKYGHLHRFLQGVQSGELKNDLDKLRQAEKSTGTKTAADEAKPRKEASTPTRTETAS